MPAAFVLDASVVVEFLAAGEHTEAADLLVGGLAWSDPLHLLAPDLLFLEAASALDRMARRRQISAREADQAVDKLPRLAIGSVPSSSLLEEAWPLRANISVYDAAYVALAMGLDLPLVSTDRKLVRAASGAGARCWALDDPELERILGTLRGSG